MREKFDVMVQELQVLKCFSCETFQSHIVKKTNKWECKVCGAKQSIKKVYGRGSGKDCRIHTQKLNAVKGEKDEQKQFDVAVHDEQMKQSSVQCDVQELAQSCNELQKPTSVPSKWEVFLNEDNLDEQRSNSILQRHKRKRSINISDSDIGRKYDEHLEACDSVDDMYSAFSKPRTHMKQTKYSRNQNKIFRNNVSSESNSMIGFDAENKPPSLKLIKPARSKVSLKWSKYIEDETENMQCTTTNTCELNDTVTDLMDVEDSAIKSGGFGNEASDHNYKLPSNVSLESNWVNGFDTKNIPRALKLIKPISKRASSKVSLKWSKYIEEDELETVQCPSTNNCELDYTVTDLFDVDDSPIESGGICNEVSDHNYKLPKSSRGMTDELILKKNQSPPVFQQSCNLNISEVEKVDSDCKYKVPNISSVSKLILAEDKSLPVFEQTSELNDSDFKLDF